MWNTMMGGYKLHYEYSQFGQATSIAFLGLDNERVNGNAGICEIMTDYNDAGNPVRICFKNAKGEWVRNEDYGYAIVENNYKDGSILSKSSYYDEQYRPCDNNNGYHSLELLYDSHNLCYQILCLNEDEELATLPYNGEVALSEKCYTANGTPSYEAYFDRYGNPISESVLLETPGYPAYVQRRFFLFDRQYSFFDRTGPIEFPIADYDALDSLIDEKVEQLKLEYSRREGIDYWR